MGKKERSALADPRFAHLTTDPTFNALRRKERKVVLESRFAAALTDPAFGKQPLVDRRGKKVRRQAERNLLTLYDPEENEEREDEEVQEEGSIYSEVDEKREESVDREEQRKKRGEEEEEGGDDEEEAKVKFDLARGEGNISSSDGESEEEWELEDVEEEHGWGELDRDARRVDWASKRLAICNLDWDSLCCEDLLMLVSSFKPIGGSVLSLTIYLSDLGKERLEKEEKEGPSIAIAEEDERDDEEEDEEKDEKSRREAIRRYQIERLKYYYAVLVCDSEQTASSIYEACDGVEYEQSGLRMDMRFVPENMEFQEDNVKERVLDDDVQVEKYKPSAFGENTALSMSKVKLTWDETNPNRTKKFKEAFDENADLDVAAKDLIASSSSEGEENEEEEEEGRASLLKKLLGEGEGEEGKFEFEFETNSDGEGDKKLSKESKSLEKKPKKDGGKSSWEEFMEKRKEKRRERKQMIKALKEKAKQEHEGVVEAESKKPKKKSVEASDATVDVDPRFSALFTDSAFVIEQSSGRVKNSKLLEKQSEEKRRKRRAEENSNAVTRKPEVDIVAKLKKKWK